MILSAQPVIWVDIIGSATTVILAVVCMKRSWSWKQKKEDNIFRHYVFLLTTAFVVFAVSRSFGHLVKQALFNQGMNLLWKQMAPYSGAVNTATFITIFALGIYFHKSRKIHMEIEHHKNNLEEMVSLRSAELEEKSRFLESTIESLNHPFYVIDPKTHEILLANRASNFNRNIGTTCYAMTHNQSTPCSGKNHPCPIAEIFRTGKPIIVEHVHQGPGGKEQVFEVHAYPIFSQNGEIDKVIEYAIDISERKETEKQLKEYNRVQHTLLREVNHRVKNNLSAIISMLYMEEERIGSIESLSHTTILNDLINRVKSLATVHSLLSEREWRPLSLTYLCHEIINKTLSALPKEKKMVLEVQPSSIQIESTAAHNLSIILNELATNTFKHAIRSEQNLEIQIRMNRVTEGKHSRVEFSYRDNGPGYPEEIVAGNFELANTGVELIHGITTTTLGGTVEFDNDRGAVTRLIFRNDLPPNNSQGSS